MKELSENPNANTQPLDSRLIASVSSVHDVSDANAVQWCPRPGFEDLLATAGDDGSIKVWKVVPASGR